MNHIEEDIQKACVEWFEYQYRRYALLLHHSPNGGYRRIKEAQRFKAMGVRAGFPDLVLFLPRQGYHALFIEMKTEDKRSRQRPEQKAWQEAVEKEGYKYVVCRSIDDFTNIINDYLK